MLDPRPAPGAAPPPTVLLVDDDLAVQDAIEMMLEADGYRVVTAADGRQALAAYPEVRPDLVITDIIMPNETGLAVLAGIKRMNPAAKVIVISGGGRTTNIDFLDMAAELGASVVLDKPCDPDELLGTVGRLLSTPTAFVDMTDVG
jgi:two-component system, chemotaxis family, chemotaxis protein CheY